MTLRTGRHRVVGILLAAAMAIAACGPEGPTREGDPSLDARIRVSPTPATLGPTRITVDVLDRGETLTRGEVSITAVGPAGDTVGPVPAPATGSAFGPATVELGAQGRWSVEIRIRAPDDRRTTVRHPLLVVGPSSN